MNLRFPRVLSAALLVGWTALVWMLLAAPHAPLEPSFPGAGILFNAGHAVLFGVEALLLGVLLRPGEISVPRRGAWLLAACAALLYAGALELVQGSLPERSASFVDMLTNAIGAFGVPWALAGTGLFGRRTWIVAAAAAASGALASSSGW